MWDRRGGREREVQGLPERGGGEMWDRRGGRERYSGEETNV